MNLQARLELEILAQQWTDSIMSQYNIAAADMENALIKVVLNLKQKILQEYLTEQQEAYQKAKTASGSVQETQEIKEN